MGCIDSELPPGVITRYGNAEQGKQTQRERQRDRERDRESVRQIDSVRQRDRQR